MLSHDEELQSFMDRISTSEQRAKDKVKELKEKILAKRKNIMLKKTGSKKKNVVELPTYKVEEKDPTYKLRRGKVMEAHSNLHANKDGKRVITTKMKIWDQLTPRDKADLKKSIMLAIDHKFKGGSISDFPDEIRKVALATHKYFEGKGLFDKPIDMGRKFVGALKTSHTNLMGTLNKAKQVADERKARGQGLVENYFKPKGHRQLIYFSDSSSDEDEPHLPIKRGRGRPRCS